MDQQQPEPAPPDDEWPRLHVTVTVWNAPDPMPRATQAALDACLQTMRDTLHWDAHVVYVGPDTLPRAVDPSR